MAWKTWQRESCFTRTMLLHTSLWLQWLLCLTVALNWLWSPSIFPWFGTIWLFSVPQHENKNKNTWLENSIGPMMRSYLQLRTFSRIRMKGASVPWESKHCNTDGRSVWTAGETKLKTKPHLIKFDHCIIVGLWTFQPTLVCSKETNSSVCRLCSCGSKPLTWAAAWFVFITTHLLTQFVW